MVSKMENTAGSMKLPKGKLKSEKKQNVFSRSVALWKGVAYQLLVGRKKSKDS